MIQEFLNEFEDLNLSKRFPGVRLPALLIEEEDYKQVGVRPDVSNYEFLRALCVKGYKEKIKNGKIPVDKKQEYAERVKFELSVFEKLNFTDYVLIVWDVINFCKKKDISTGPGRGSVCGSLIFYLIDVTWIDPIKYDLYFQRFVSEFRAKSQVIDGITYLDGSLMCDVDLDIDFLRRHEVVEYLDKKYPNRTSKILNLSTLTGKNLIKEVGKVVGEKSEHEMNEVSGMIEKLFGNVADIEDSYKKNKQFKSWCDENSRIYEIALCLRDLIKNKSVHASGLVISHDELTGKCPIELTSDKDLVSGFSMKDILAFCVKLDLLGLKTVSFIRQVCDLAGIKMMDIPFEDPICYQPLTNPLGLFYGIFQVDAYTASKIVRKVKPSTIDELSDVMAIARPGAMQFVDEYVDNKTKGYIDSFHPVFDKILEKTWGICLYQEQLMKMANAVGFTLDEAEILRRIVGKKDQEAAKEWEAKIYKKVEESGLPKKVGEFLWDVLDKSKDYSFNKSHSVAYSAIAGMTAYLKMKYPVEFFLVGFRMSRIMADANESAEEKVERLAKESKFFGIQLLPPDLLIGNEEYILEDGKIRFGLSSVKGVAESKLVKLREFSVDAPNKLQLFESAKTAKIDIGTLCSLIQVGSLQSFGENRTRMVLEAQLWNLLSSREKEYCLQNGAKYDWDVINMVKDINNWTSEPKPFEPESLKAELVEQAEQQLGLIDETVAEKIEKEIKKAQKKAEKDGPKPIVRASRLDTIRKAYLPFKNIYEQNSKHEQLANYFYEKRLLGYCYSTTLRDIFSKACPELLTVAEFDSLEDKEVGTFVGVVDKIIDATSKNGNKYTKIILSDGTGILTAMSFEPHRTKLKQANKMPKEGDVCGIKGVKSNTMLQINNISPQNNKVYIKKSDLKDE